jgi:predicted CoA-binding protein
MKNPSDKELRQILTNSNVIAVVGHSDKPQRPSYRVAGYLRQAGYQVYPVNPTVEQIDGQRSYPSLAEIPEPIDIVDVFRRPEHLEEIVEQAIRVGAKVVWAQLDIYDEGAAKKARQAGLIMVMDRCIQIEHRRLMR